MTKVDVLLAGLSLALYGVLWFGAEIYGSYRYEPSGVQYIFLPFLAAPACAAVGAALWIVAQRAQARTALRVLPLLGCAVLAFPPMVMLLSNRNLEAGRNATVAIGALHAALLLLHMGSRLRRTVADPARQTPG